MLDKVPVAPELRPWLEPVYAAFWELSSCRQLGMAEGPIPWTAIDAYATAHSFDAETRDDLHFHVRSMDRAFLAHRAERAEKERKRHGGENKSGSVRSKHPQKGRGRRAGGQ